MIKNISIHPWEVFIDLWCWDGNLMYEIKSKHPWIIIRWYEIDKKYYNLAKEKQKNHNDKVQIFNTNFFYADLSTANIIYCYLMPHLMKSVRKKN